MEKKDKKSESGATRVNKTRLIKEVARELREKTGSRPRPQDICRACAARGVNVSSPQVSQALAGTDLAFRQKRGADKPPSGREEFTQRIFPDPAAAIGLISIDDLIAARKYVLQVGTLEKATAALVAFRQFGSGEAKTGPREDVSSTRADVSSEGAGHDRSPSDHDAGVAPEMRKVV